MGVVRSQHVGERLADVRAPSGGSDVQDGDRFAVEGAAADRPVERVLERSRDSKRVFRDREQYAVRGLAVGPEALNDEGRRGFEVGVELRQLPHRIRDRDRDRAACRRQGSGTEGGGVDRATPGDYPG